MTVQNSVPSATARIQISDADSRGESRSFIAVIVIISYRIKEELSWKVLIGLFLSFEKKSHDEIMVRYLRQVI